MTFDFVIVNYKCTEDTARLMMQVKELFPYEHSITVIDNTLLNRGFAKAVNLGASIGNADIVVLLNPDIILVPGWADDTVAALEADANLVIAGPRLNDGIRPNINQWEKDWVCGACFFVRRSLLDITEGFDERYFFGYEETDLIRQAKELGYDVRVQHHEFPMVIHERSDSQFHYEQYKRSEAEYKKKWRTNKRKWEK